MDYIRFIRVICWVCKDFDKLLYCKFCSEFNIKNCNSKMCQNYVSLCNIEISEKLKDKRKVVSNHKKLIKEDKCKLKNMKTQLLLFSSCKLAV